MATGYDISKYLAQAEAHTDEGGGNFERWDPPAGWRGRCKVVRVNARLSDKGEPGWGLWVEVIDSGEHQGKRFWFNADFSDTWAFKTKHAIETMQGFGLTLQFIAANGNNKEVIATALEGKVGIVTAKWGKNKTNPDKPYANHTVAPSKAAPPAARPVEDDDEDDYDEDYETEHPDYQEDEEEDFEPEEDEDPEPEPQPVRRTKAKKAPAKRKPAAKAADPDEDFED